MTPIKKPSSPPNASTEIDVSDLVIRLQEDAQRIYLEEIDAAEAEGLSEDEALRRVATALRHHSYRDERGNVAPVPDGLRQRMSVRMGCLPEEVDRFLRIREAMDRVSELYTVISDVLEQERDAIEEEMRNGDVIADESIRQRFLVAHERGWAAGIQKLREDEAGE